MDSFIFQFCDSLEVLAISDDEDDEKDEVLVISDSDDNESCKSDINISDEDNDLREPHTCFPSVEEVIDRESTNDLRLDAQRVSHSNELYNDASQMPNLIFFTESVFIPTVSALEDSTLGRFYNFRYKILTFMGTPVKFIPEYIPYIGKKSISELYLFFIYNGMTAYFTWYLYHEDHVTSGEAASYVSGLAVLFACRNSVYTILFQMSFERALFWHKVLAFCAVSLSGIHAYLVLDGDLSFAPYTWDNISQNSNFSGLVLRSIMFGTSVLYYLTYIRLPFELFYFIHVVAFVVILLLAYFHGAYAFAGAGLFWLSDLFMRYVIALKKVTCTASIYHSERTIVKLSVPTHSIYSPSQFCFLMVPDLSFYQFHPFSISSSPEEANMTFIVQVAGDWTSKLVNLVEKKCVDAGGGADAADAGAGARAPTAALDIFIEGPFGALTIDVFNSNYEAVLLMSAGSAVTATRGVYKHLQYLHRHRGRASKLKRCDFIFSVKRAVGTEAFDLSPDWTEETKSHSRRTVSASNREAWVEGEHVARRWFTSLFDSVATPTSRVTPDEFLNTPTDRSVHFHSHRVDSVKEIQRVHPSPLPQPHRPLSGALGVRSGAVEQDSDYAAAGAQRNVEQRPVSSDGVFRQIIHLTGGNENLENQETEFIKYKRFEFLENMKSMSNYCAAHGITRCAILVSGVREMHSDFERCVKTNKFDVVFDIHRDFGRQL